MSTRVTRNSGGLDAVLADELEPAIAPVEPEIGALRGLFVSMDSDMMIHVLRNIGAVEVHFLPVDRFKEVVLLVPDDAAFHHLLGVAAGGLTSGLRSHAARCSGTGACLSGTLGAAAGRTGGLRPSQPPRTTGLTIREGKGVFSSTLLLNWSPGGWDVRPESAGFQTAGTCRAA